MQEGVGREQERFEGILVQRGRWGEDGGVNLEDRGDISCLEDVGGEGGQLVLGEGRTGGRERGRRRVG